MNSCLLDPVVSEYYVIAVSILRPGTVAPVVDRRVWRFRASRPRFDGKRAFDPGGQWPSRAGRAQGHGGTARLRVEAGEVRQDVEVIKEWLR